MKIMTELIPVSATVNGVPQRMAVPSHLILADLLREHLGLMGCRVACDQGICGSCTVLLDGVPATACSILAFEIDGKEVITIEGLTGNGKLDPVQEAFLAGDAFQCGFCTAGMILAAKALLAPDPAPSEAAIRQALVGNICRCTGYQMIIEAVQNAAAAIRRRKGD
jgi:carbon-monoxide dehydrogenase small subunit